MCCARVQIKMAARGRQARRQCVFHNESPVNSRASTLSSRPAGEEGNQRWRSRCFPAEWCPWPSLRGAPVVAPAPQSLPHHAPSERMHTESVIQRGADARMYRRERGWARGRPVPPIARQHALQCSAAPRPEPYKVDPGAPLWLKPFGTSLWLNPSGSSRFGTNKACSNGERGTSRGILDVTGGLRACQRGPRVMAYCPRSAKRGAYSPPARLRHFAGAYQSGSGPDNRSAPAIYPRAGTPGS